jgi:hypothetical protein
MIGWLGYHYHLYRIQRKRRRIRRTHAKEWAKAKAENKSESELGALTVITIHENESIDDEIADLLSHYLFSLGEQYRIPLPPPDIDNINWQMSKYTGTYRLTNDAILKLRVALRTEQKDRSEIPLRWLTGLTGLIGVLIGLAAVILGRR